MKTEKNVNIKEKVKEIIAENKWFVFQLIVAITSFVFALFFAPDLSVVNWESDIEAFKVLKFFVLPLIIGLVFLYLAFSEVIKFLLDALKTILTIVAFSAFSMLWNPFPFTSSFYDVWIKTGASIDNKSNLMILTVVFLSVLSFALFYRMFRVLGKIGVFLWLILVSVTLYTSEKSDLITFKDYDIMVFVSLWLLIFMGMIWIGYQKITNTKAVEDEDTSGD